MESTALRTTTALLAHLGQSQGESAELAWMEFDARYRPLLTRLFWRLGFRDADAADLSQESLLRFMRDYRRGSYSRERGRLRDWLMAIARSRAIDSRRKRVVSTLRDTQLDEQIDASAVRDAFEGALGEHVLAHALTLLRRHSEMDERTLQAFEETAVRGRSAREVAEELGVSLSVIYVSRHRAMGRLHELRAEIENAIENDAPPEVPE